MPPSEPTLVAIPSSQRRSQLRPGFLSLALTPPAPTAPAGAPTGSALSSRPACRRIDRSRSAPRPCAARHGRARQYRLAGQADTSGRCCSLTRSLLSGSLQECLAPRRSRRDHRRKPTAHRHAQCHPCSGAGDRRRFRTMSKTQNQDIPALPLVPAIASQTFRGRRCGRRCAAPTNRFPK